MSMLLGDNFAPRPRLSIAGYRLVSWRACAGLGILLGALTLVALMHIQGARGIGVLMVAANLLTFRVVIVISKRLFHGARIVLLKYLLIALGVTALGLAASPVPMLAGLDAWIVAMVLGLAIGRIGCLMAGCCHGRVAAHGVTYPWLRWAGAPRCLDHVQLRPVQAYEATLLALIFAAGLLLFSLPHQPGDVLVLFLGAYGAGRFGLEFLRGDSRPYLGLLSEAQWTCLGLILAVIVLGVVDAGDRRQLWLGWGGLSLALVAGLSLRARRYLGPSPLRPLNKFDLDDFAQTVWQVRSAVRHGQQSNNGPSLGAKGQTRRGLRVTGRLSVDGDGRPVERYQISGPRGRLDDEMMAFVACLAGEALERGGDQ